ncbi:MAG: hypothetical protein QXT44_01185 [Candidatus Bathyarchaeia archaeon]
MRHGLDWCFLKKPTKISIPNRKGAYSKKLRVIRKHLSTKNEWLQECQNVSHHQQSGIARDN